MNGRTTLPNTPLKAIEDALHWEKADVTWLAGDGSDRCYYRIRNLSNSETYVLMQLAGEDGKLLKGDDYEWIKIGKLLHAHGIYAPQTIASIPDHAALIIEDYGNTMMETAVLESLKQEGLEGALRYYKKSFDVLARFLQIEESGSSRWKERSFDAARFDWELHFFREHFLENVLGWTLNPAEIQAFTEDSIALAKALAEASHYFVHRDFHSRNVMIKGSDLAVIDFQDARLGPPTYDLVSLCFDSYIPLDFATRENLVQEGVRALSQARSDLSLGALNQEWPKMLLQRQLKAIGSFGYLTVKKNRGNYLKYVQPALATLPLTCVFDSRWPFLSGTLLEQIQARWAIQGTLG